MLIDLLTAWHQANKAKKIKADRPTYEIPKEVQQNKDMYQSLANSSRIPGQSIADNNRGASSAASLAALMKGSSSSSDILYGLSQVNQNNNNAINDLAMQGAQYQAMNRDKLADANSQLAEYKDQAFDYNKNQPYELALMRKRALEGAAYGNVNSAGRDMHQAGMSFLSLTGGGKGK